MPALIKALRIQEKAKQVGFEWKVTSQVKSKLMEELSELDEVIAEGNQDRMEDEFGDVLFSMVNYARFLNIDPENALERTNKKFKKRFEQMEAIMTNDNKELSSYTLEQMDAVWNEIKKNEHK